MSIPHPSRISAVGTSLVHKPRNYTLLVRKQAVTMGKAEKRAEMSGRFDVLFGRVRLHDISFLFVCT
jgi:hypothetical protein